MADRGQRKKLIPGVEPGESGPLRILFIVAYPAAARVRPRELIRALARRGHEITVATLWETEADREGLAHLEAEGITILARRQSKVRSLWNSLRALPGRDPLQAHYSWNPSLAAALEDALRTTHYDLIHIEHLRAAKYGLALQSNIPIIWDSVDCISHLFEQSSRYGQGFFPKVITRLDLPRTRRYEARLLAQFDHVLVTSEIDRQALLDLSTPPPDTRYPVPSPRSPISVLPNGVDLDYFEPQLGEREPDTLVYVGRMSYHANVAAVDWFCGEVLPRLWAERPDVRLFIVGMDPAPAVRALALNPRIIVTGTVPDVRPYLARATALVAPMVYGAGIQNKVLEGLATCTPVVCTPLAAAALQAEAERDLLVADSAADLAHTILRLLDDSELQQSLGRMGRKYVEANHDWDRIALNLEDIYREAIETKVHS